MMFTILQWPEIQEYMEKPGFYENCFPVLDENGIREFGDQSYFCRLSWLNVN